jgi:hypothetical protein
MRATRSSARPRARDDGEGRFWSNPPRDSGFRSWLKTTARALFGGARWSVALLLFYDGAHGARPAAGRSTPAARPGNAMPSTRAEFETWMARLARRRARRRLRKSASPESHAATGAVRRTRRHALLSPARRGGPRSNHMFYRTRSGCMSTRIRIPFWQPQTARPSGGSSSSARLELPE